MPQKSSDCLGLLLGLTLHLHPLLSQIPFETPVRQRKSSNWPCNQITACEVPLGGSVAGLDSWGSACLRSVFHVLQSSLKEMRTSVAPRRVRRGYTQAVNFENQQLAIPVCVKCRLHQWSRSVPQECSERLQLWRWRQAHRQISKELSEHSLEVFSRLCTICICVKLLYIISANKFCNTIFIANIMTGLHNKLVYCWISIVFKALVHRKKELQEQFRLHIGLCTFLFPH